MDARIAGLGWDQLDEDWVEQPPSSPVPSLPLPPSSPAAAKSPSAAQKSRIPRFANRRSSATTSPPRPAALSERSANVPTSPSLPQRKPDQARSTTDTRPSTNSSGGGSVVHHNGGSVVRNAKESALTPEWKKALRKQDLFSSTTGLEQIFQKPDQTLSASPIRKSYDFTDGNTSMPSSPPVMTQPHHVVSDANENLRRPSQALHDIAEEDEEAHDSHQSQVNNADALDSSGIPQNNSPTPIIQARSTTTSSVAEFSPVYISKHNTIDGKVDYAAFDPSELPQLGEFVSMKRGTVNSDDNDSFHRKPLSASVSSVALVSDSVAPSDSVSQTGKRADSHRVEALALASLSPIKEDFGRPASAPGKPQGSETVSLAVPVPSRSNKSSIETAFRTEDVSLPKPTADTDSQMVASAFTFDEGIDSAAKSARPDVFEDEASSVSEVPPPISSKKRKDARYDQHSASPNPSIIAKREILHPRKSSVRSNNRPHSSRASSASSISRPRNGSRNNFEMEGLKSSGPDAMKARALASEVAGYRLKSSHPRLGELRKKSFSTQDYLNEAMKIMELIRTRKNVPSEADSSEQAENDAWVDQADGNIFSSDSFSRPPSRDGPRSGWRSERQVQVDPQVLHHLKKYEETGDESFLVTSIVKSVRAAETEASMLDEMDSSLPQSAQSMRHRRFSDSMLEQAEHQSMSSPIKTQTSYQSTGSAQTVATTSTQRARSMRTIAPENITHLIREEEAGMRFDTGTQTWIRQRRLRARPSAGLSSSTGTEANVLNEIPDLSVNEALETERSRVFSGQHQSWPANTSDVAQGAGDAEQPADAEGLVEDDLDSFIHSEPHPDMLLERHDQEKSSHFAASKDELEAEIEVLPTVEGSDQDIEYIDARDPRSRRREQSVLFSSPPVSREYDAKNWTDSTGPNHEPGAHTDEDSGLSYVPPFTSRNMARKPLQSTSRTRSHSHLIESHEISFQEQGPHGRTLSMSLSIATPNPSRRSATAPVLAPSSAIRQQSFLKTLSPMSEFSEHQSDERHKESLALGQSLLQVKQHQNRFKVHAAQSTEELVRHLTDAEPNEPYWDFMSKLDLSGHDMATTHSLDVFCPRLESLDVSENKLEHLQGMPPNLRDLTITQNQLTSLTNWSHLLNLQYLDVSHNRLTTLDGLSNLVHLRGLKADHNKITSVSGILDLDGLLSVNLASNKIKSVDFRTTCLKRLVDVDLKYNAVEEILGLSGLVALEKLNLEDNELSQLGASEDSTNENFQLRVLKLSRNRLQSLSVSSFPSLEVLEADNNSLVRVEGVSNHAHLKALHLRTQSTKGTHDFSTYANLEELHLSGSSLPARLPLKVAFLRLHTLDISHTGVQSLPSDFGLLAPNLQTLSMNSCHIKDLRPLLGIVGLRRLRVVGNRIARLRSTVRVLKALSALRGGVLEELDFRGNPLVHGFYPSADGDGSVRSLAGLQRATEEADAALDTKYAARLDDDTRMKRRVFELLVAAKCPRLARLDGLAFDRTRVERRDEVWDMLVDSGVVEASK